MPLPLEIRRHMQYHTIVLSTQAKRVLTKERNQSMENALKHWHYIADAGEKYVKPFRNQADLVINGNSDLAYFAKVLQYIYEITNNFQV